MQPGKTPVNEVNYSGKNEPALSEEYANLFLAFRDNIFQIFFLL